MKAIHISIPSAQKDYYTSDFIDLINEIEALPEGAKLEITTHNMTVSEFHELTEDYAPKNNTEQ